MRRLSFLPVKPTGGGCITGAICPSVCDYNVITQKGGIAFKCNGYVFTAEQFHYGCMRQPFHIFLCRLGYAGCIHIINALPAALTYFIPVHLDSFLPAFSRAGAAWVDRGGYFEYRGKKQFSISPVSRFRLFAMP